MKARDILLMGTLAAGAGGCGAANVGPASVDAYNKELAAVVKDGSADQAEMKRLEALAKTAEASLKKLDANDKKVATERQNLQNIVDNYKGLQAEAAKTVVLECGFGYDFVRDRGLGNEQRNYGSRPELYFRVETSAEKLKEALGGSEERLKDLQGKKPLSEVKRSDANSYRIHVNSKEEALKLVELAGGSVKNANGIVKTAEDIAMLYDGVVGLNNPEHLGPAYLGLLGSKSVVPKDYAGAQKVEPPKDKPKAAAPAENN